MKKTWKNDQYLNQAKFNEYLAFATKLRLKKMDDYGLSYRRLGNVGILARIADKISRLENMANKKIALKNESAFDSTIDIANYSIMLGMELTNGKLPKSIQKTCRKNTSCGRRRAEQ